MWSGVLGASVSATVLAFAVASLAAWLVLRVVFGLPKDNVKVVEHDINENRGGAVRRSEPPDARHGP